MGEAMKSNVVANEDSAFFCISHSDVAGIPRMGSKLYHALAISFSAELSRLKAGVAAHAKLKTHAAAQKEAAKYHQPPSSTLSLSAKCRYQQASITAEETDMVLSAWGPLAGAQVVVIGRCLGVKKQETFSSSAPLVFQHGQVCRVERDWDPATPHALVVYVARQPQVSKEDEDKRQSGAGGCMSCFMSRKPEPRDLEDQSRGRKASPHVQGMQAIEVSDSNSFQTLTPDQDNLNQGSQNLMTIDEGERKQPYLALRIVFSDVDKMAEAEAALAPLLQYVVNVHYIV
jgi:hypothetical protein